MKKYAKILPLLILSALLVGVGIGHVCALFPALGSGVIPVASWCGTAFMNLLKMLVIPLVFSSLVCGVMNIGSGSALGRIGLKTMGLYLLTTLIATATGLVLVNTIQPGLGMDLNLGESGQSIAQNPKGLGEILNNLLPSNIVQSMANGEMLHLIFFAILFGLFAGQLEQKSRTFLLTLFQSIFDVMMRMTHWVILWAPLGVLGIVIREVSRHPDLGAVASSLGLFMLTVIASLGFHFLVTLPLLLRLVGRINPWKHLRNMGTPLLTAFTTASSSATLPLTMQALEERDGVSNRISSFCLPLGATINMDGTALFECVATIFIAQAYGVDLGLGAQLVIVFTALITSIGCAGIPMASFVMLVIILTAVGLPLEGLSLILAIDFLLDMLRTTTNIWSDTCVALLVAKSEGEELNV